MNNARFLAALLLALPLAAVAQTKPTPAPTKPTQAPAAVPKPAAGTQQVTEVTEDLDPATGKVIRRTTRTTTVPIDSSAPARTTARTTIPTTTSATMAADARGTDAQVSAFLRHKTTVATLTGSGLLAAYASFTDRVRDRQSWKPADWAMASAVLSSLNGRYEQLRGTLSLDDKLTIRSQQAEFQAVRTARQLSDQVSDKL